MAASKEVIAQLRRVAWALRVGASLVLSSLLFSEFQHETIGDLLFGVLDLLCSLFVFVFVFVFVCFGSLLFPRLWGGDVVGGGGGLLFVIALSLCSFTSDFALLLVPNHRPNPSI